MGHSNEEWADFAADPEANRRWDEYIALPELPTDNSALNTFLAEKGITREELMRVGARFGAYKGRHSLVYWFPPGFRKYRTFQGQTLRGSDEGAEWTHLKLITGVRSTGLGVIIAEGETDAAVLTRIAPEHDIAVLPAGAKHFTENMADQLDSYTDVLVGTDNDPAGDEGAARIMRLIPRALRLRPPGGKDWCEAVSVGAVAHGWVPVGEARPKTVFTIREVLDADLGTLSENNWFADGIAPVGGEIVLHGPMKSLKSVILMEMIRAIATGTEFAGYIPFIRDDGPGKVLLFQMEIPPGWFQKRIEGMVTHMGASEAAMFEENVMVYGIANRRMPRLKVGSDDFRPTIEQALMDSDADVVAFDPVQRLTGGINSDKSYELEPLFATFEWLMDQGITVIYTHHDNKTERNTGSAYAMSGNQRFGADADSILSVYHDKNMIPDDNPDKKLQRNFRFTLRSGAAAGRSITAAPSSFDPNFMIVEYDDPVMPKPKVTSAPSSSATSTSLPSIT